MGPDFGGGFGKGQIAGAEGIQDFISARQSPEQFAELMGPLRKMFDIETERAAAAQRESLGMTGNRFSTSLAREQGRLRGERSTELDALMSQLFLGEQGKLLQALGMQHDMGTAAIEPFFRFAEMGILPEQLYKQDSAWKRYSGVAKDFLEIVKGIRDMGNPFSSVSGGGSYEGG